MKLIILASSIFFFVLSPLAHADCSKGREYWNSTDFVRAVKSWSHEANINNDPCSMLSLGHAYLEGLGAPQDFIEAHKWFNLAAISGNADASAKREFVEKKMTPDERVEAQRLAKVWYGAIEQRRAKHSEDILSRQARAIQTMRSDTGLFIQKSIRSCDTTRAKSHSPHWNISKRYDASFSNNILKVIFTTIGQGPGRHSPDRYLLKYRHVKFVETYTYSIDLRNIRYARVDDDYYGSVVVWFVSLENTPFHEQRSYTETCDGEPCGKGTFNNNVNRSNKDRSVRIETCNDQTTREIADRLNRMLNDIGAAKERFQDSQSARNK